MPYLTIAQAAEATGKSEKTIRRLIKQPTAAPFVTRDGDGPNAPVQIDASYLQSVYPMSIPTMQKRILDKGSQGRNSDLGQDQDKGQTNDQTAQSIAIQAEMLAILKEQLRLKDEQLAARDRRIEDLTDKLTHIRLITEAPREEQRPEEQKKSWWRW